MASTAQQQQFQATYGPLAQQAGTALGVDPNVIFAQWALESGWGTPNAETNNYNVAGIEPNGVGASYSSPQAFEQAYVQQIQNNFPQAMNTGSNASAFVSGLLNGRLGKYFTGDPTSYVNNVSQIAATNPLGASNVAPVGTTSAANGGAQTVSGTTTGTGTTQGATALQGTWGQYILEMFTRGGVIMIGMFLLMIGLIFLFLNSRTVQTTARNVAALG